MIRIALLLFASTALAWTARAGQFIIDSFSTVGIYYGSAELFSPAGVLLSTTQAITMEGTPVIDFCPAPQADQVACATAVGQSALQGIPNPPFGDPALPPVFAANFLSQLPAFVNTINGIGNASPSDFVSYDPNNTPTPTSDQLYRKLTAGAGNFIVTSDTGFVPYFGPADFALVWQITLPVPVDVILTAGGQPTCCATSEVGSFAVEFFERDLRLTEVAAPEPGGTGLAGIALLLVLLARRRA
ncbi:MAG: hypothetical protein P4L56_04790 [Candidatus Sulfopaludibacter sp.]|nr:hypothetical protein [Candidatus Sulfopaludibacter sp.]